MADTRTHDLRRDTLSRFGEIRDVEDDILTTHGYRLPREGSETHVIDPASGQLVHRDTALLRILRTVRGQRGGQELQQEAQQEGDHGATVAPATATRELAPQ